MLRLHPSPLSPSCTQYDVHLPLLTVRETLAFARDALWAAGTKNDLAAEFHQVLEAEASEVGSAVLVSRAFVLLPCRGQSKPHQSVSLASPKQPAEARVV